MAKEFTPVEHYQIKNRMSTQDMDASEYERTLFVFIKHKPWRERVMQNPFGDEAVNLMEIVFAPELIFEARIAAVLGEPKKAYDFEFEKLGKEERRDALYREIETSAEATMRLAQYVYEHMDDLWSLSDKELFLELKTLAFNGLSDAEIGETYSRQQRRGFNLAIVNFIQDREILRDYKETIEKSPKERLGEILGIALDGPFEFECLAVGLVVYLSDNDWIKFNEINNFDKGTESDYYGKSLSWIKSLPPALRDKVVILHTGGERTGFREKTDIEGTRQHELRHILHSSFTSSAGLLSAHEVSIKIQSAGSIVLLHQEVADQLVNLLGELARDEFIAYNSTGNLKYTPRLVSLGEKNWEEYLEIVGHAVSEIYPLGKREKIQKIYYGAYAQYLRNIRQYRWVFTQVMDFTRINPGQLSSEKAEALLYNVLLNKAKRLGHFLGVEPIAFMDGFYEGMNEMAKDFDRKVQKADRARHVRLFGRKLFKTHSSTQWLAWNNNVPFEESYLLTLFHPEEAIPSYLQVLENSNDYYRLEHCLEALKYAVLSTHTFSPDLHTRINASINKLLYDNREKFEEVIKSAKEVQGVLNKAYSIRA